MREYLNISIEKVSDSPDTNISGVQGFKKFQLNNLSNVRRITYV